MSRITDKLVSIKVFSLPTSFFQAEDLELVKTIEHPFIEKLLDVYVENQQMWFVRDYNQLGSIADIMKMTQNPLNEPEISCICYSTLYALDYIHTLNKVHKGVKLNNIIVNSAGQIKLTDFGIHFLENLISSTNFYRYFNKIFQSFESQSQGTRFFS